MKKEHYVILGGGISGLALGWYLKKKFQDNIRLTIVEKSTRAGGWIRSNHDHGFLFEEGPRSCRTQGAGIATLELIEELGLENEVICSSPEANKKYLYLGKQLQCMPQGILSSLFSPLVRPLLPAFCKEWLKAPNRSKEESIYDFFARRFSPHLAETFIDPMVSGIYAGDIRKLSMQSCFPQFYALEQEFGSLTKGMLFGKKTSTTSNSAFVERIRKAPMFSFKGGMETIVNALSKQLHKHINYNSEATALKLFPDKICVNLVNGQCLEAQRVLLALPAQPALNLLKHSFPSMVNDMPNCQTSSVAAINLGWSEKVLNYQGFGYLIPSGEQEKVLGVVWDSSVFPQQNRQKNETRLTVMLGGTRFPEVDQLPANTLKQYAQHAIKQHLKIDEVPQVMNVCLAKQAIPQYALGHAAKLKLLEESLAALSTRITLHGSAWHGVAVNECILKAKEFSMLELKNDGVNNDFNRKN